MAVAMSRLRLEFRSSWSRRNRRPPPASSGPEEADTMSRPAVAALLSFLIPGLGQIYNREVLRGLFWLIITPALWIGSAGLFGWIVHLISAATAYHRAELQDGLPRPSRLDWRSL